MVQCLVACFVEEKDGGVGGFVIRLLSACSEVERYYRYVENVYGTVVVHVRGFVPAWGSRLGAEGVGGSCHVEDVYFEIAVHVSRDCPGAGVEDVDHVSWHASYHDRVPIVSPYCVGLGSDCCRADVVSEVGANVHRPSAPVGAGRGEFNGGLEGSAVVGAACDESVDDGASDRPSCQSTAYADGAFYYSWAGVQLDLLALVVDNIHFALWADGHDGPELDLIVASHWSDECGCAPGCSVVVGEGQVDVRVSSTP